MGARELLSELAGAGFTVEADGDRLLIRPAAKLTDELRATLRAAKPDLLALLAPNCRPYRLSKAEANAAHAEPWDEAACSRFVARVGLFMRRGINATDADDLAERLHLRDVQGDERVSCPECTHYRPGSCGNHLRAGLAAPDIGPDLAGLLQLCPGFQPAR